MKRFTWKDKMGYRIDKLLSKGTGVLILVLFGITALVVVIAALAMLLFDPDYAQNAGSSIWSTFMYAIDAGTLAGYNSTVMGVVMLALTTICGIFITSMLIGILNTGFEGKLESLKKGTSKVMEEGHTVIIGFNENIYTLVTELILANENKKKAIIVVLGKEEKSWMEAELQDRIADWKTTTILCRSGLSSDIVALKRCSIETAKSVIVNEKEDSEVIKTILATTHVLRSEGSKQTHITANINEEQNIEVAKIAGEGRVEIVYFKSAISRIIANTCHQSGLSEVYTELFNFDGDEIYVEEKEALVGKTFFESILMFENATVLGIQKGKLSMVNPPMGTVFEKGDQVILLAEDDGVSIPKDTLPAIEEEKLEKTKFPHSTKQKEHLLVLGYNELLPSILEELEHYVAEGSMITVAAETMTAEQKTDLLKDYEHMTVTVDVCDIYNGQTLLEYMKQGFEHVIVLSVDEDSIENSDAKNLMILLHLKSISERYGMHYSVISQMLSADNGELAKVANVNDFIISTNLTSLMISQIAENRNLASIFEDILDAEGSELYMKPAKYYVKTNMPVSLYTVAYAAASKGEVFMGIKVVERNEDGKPTVKIITNQAKSEQVTFGEDDLLILVAQEA